VTPTPDEALGKTFGLLKSIFFDDLNDRTNRIATIGLMLRRTLQGSVRFSAFAECFISS
jgi:hypothetical protein